MVSGAECLPPRLFEADADVRRIADGLIARTLPRADWTHEAHLAAVSVIILERPAMFAERDLPAIIAAYNLAAGGVNDETQGYHETITQYWIWAARRFHVSSEGGLAERVNAFIRSDAGRRDAPLRHYSPERLFSVEARMRFMEPDCMRFGDDHGA